MAGCVLEQPASEQFAASAVDLRAHVSFVQRDGPGINLHRMCRKLDVNGSGRGFLETVIVAVPMDLRSSGP